ncbi:MAG: zinc ABC transporter substrate-binding protein, partial [Actinomycetota bacterium]|nr:zinc ABC transporter substrate-binding protein [Actinomycetota bacterium]
LDNGLGLEAWFERFVADLDVPHAVLSEGLEPIPVTHDAYAGHANPHAWMSPAGGAHYARRAAEAFAELDPAGAAEYRANPGAFAARLEELHSELVAAVEAVPEAARILVTCEGAFSYLARDAGLDEAYIWPVNAEQQATPRRVARVIDLVREREVPAVFCESTASAQPMERVAESSGARLAGTLYVDSLSEPDGPVPTYLDLLSHDIDVIVAGLTGAPS